MTLRCPKCTSKYKVRDDIITAEGIKAKCYKCGSIFFVRKKEAVELNNIVSSLKENISKWEERAIFEGAGGKGIETEIEHNGTDVKEERDEVGELLNEIESDILKEKILPGEERLKDSLKEDLPISEEKTIEEELAVFTEDIMPPVAAESKKDEPYTAETDIDEFLNELEEKKADEGNSIETKSQTFETASQIPPPESIPELSVPESPVSESPELDSGLAQGSTAVEGEKQAETNLKSDLPIFTEGEFIPLDTDIKGGGILSQEEMNKLLAGSLEPASMGETAGEKALTEGMELPAAPQDTASLQGGYGGEVDLDKLMEDTAVEIGIGDAQKGSAASGEAMAEPPAPSEFDELMKKASESLDGTMVSSENLETEVHRPVSDTASEDVSAIDVMGDMEEEFKPKDAGFFGKIMERVQYLAFFVSSYLSRLRGRFFKKPAQQDFDRFASLTTGLTEGPSADLAEAHPGKIKITWKLIVLSLIILAILAGGIGVIVVAGKKWMAGVKERDEIVAVKERPSAERPHVEEKKPVVSEANLTEEPVKPLEAEKPPEIEKKPAAGEANLTESQQPSQAEIQTAAPPPAPVVPEERLARLGIILPVSFSSEETKVMTMNVKLELENKEAADMIKGNPFYYEGIIEDFVDQFFKDKFYEDTHFVREKLKEAILRQLNENIKNGRIKKVDIEELKVK